MKRGTPPSAPPRHQSFGITDSLLDAVKNMYRSVGTTSQPETEVAEEPEVKNKNPQQLDEDAGGKYDRPALKTRDRKIARKSSKLRSKGSVGSDTTARFKQRHAGKTVPTRKGTEGQPRATGATADRGGSKRPVGGMSAVHHDLGNQPEADFRRKYGKSKSAMRTGLRNSVEFDGEDNLNEMHITVQMNPGGTSYKVLSVSKDIGGRVRVGETLSDTHIDDLRDSDVSISYKKDGGGTGKMEAKEAIMHNCANHVKSEQWGDGQCVPGMHTLEEISEGEGYVTHYDVMFEHGIEENVAIEDLQIISERHHGHSKKKAMKEDDNGDEDDNGNGNGKSKKKKKLDKVDKDELKGSHDDREDGDIDNDGDEDDSDKFLHKKRKAVSKAMKKKNGNGNGDDDVEEAAPLGHPTDASGKPHMVDPRLLKKKPKPTGGTQLSAGMTYGTKKNSLKEWVAMGNKKPGTEQVKDAMEAYQLAQHYLQMGSRDEMFGKKDRTNMKLAKQFYEQYKELKAKGDESADDLFKNELVDDAIESFSETEKSQTNESWYEPTQQSSGSHVQKKPMPRTQTGAPHKIRPQYNTKTHKLVKRKGQAGLTTKPKDYKLGRDEYEAEEVQHEDLTPAQNQAIKAAGEKIKASPLRKAQAAKMKKDYPQATMTHADSQKAMKEGIQDKEHAPEVVEYTHYAYDYNRKSWMDALDEVNRYKGRSGHRVTKPEKEGPEHIVMQMRKVMSLGDNHQGVDFGDGTKHKVSKATAGKFLDKYNRSKPEEKEKLQRSASHSHGGLHHAASDKPIEHGPGQQKKAMFKPAARREPLRGVQHPDDK